MCLFVEQNSILGDVAQNIIGLTSVMMTSIVYECIEESHKLTRKKRCSASNSTSKVNKMKNFKQDET